MKRSTLLYDSAGWPTPHGRRLCHTQNIAPCHQVPVWRTTKQGRGYVQYGYYCDRHLPAEHRSPAPPPASAGPPRATHSQDLLPLWGTDTAKAGGGD